MDFDLLRIKVNYSDSGVVGYDDVLMFSTDGSQTLLEEDFEVCRWSSNWLLNLLSNAFCGSNSCEPKRHLYQTLDAIARRRDMFSVMGFESKFSRVCRRIKSKGIRSKIKRTTTTTTTTQRPHVIPSPVVDVETEFERLEFTPSPITKSPPTTTTTTTPSPLAETRPPPPPPNPSSTSSYVTRYLNMMDQLTGSPEMIRYRLRLMFKDLRAKEGLPRESPRSSTGDPGQRKRVSLMVLDRMCRNNDRGKAFVVNHLRDVVYSSDLRKALKLSLSFKYLPLEDDSPEVRRVLRNYLRALIGLFPTSETTEEPLRRYLKQLLDFVSEDNDRKS